MGTALNVLVAVRDADERELISRMLRRSGWAVATSEEGAVEITGAVDLLIAEVDPLFDGRLIAERLRADSPGLPVLFITGWFDHPDFADLSRARILTKPYSRDELIRAIGVAVGASPDS